MPENLIHILPPQVANQIAAGEVVERPASAMKELIENSIDAGATRVVVRIEGAGKKRIEVDDNGYGMSAADAELALQRHATSKIESSADLHCIASHGFRGEALPSIASVSRFRMQTSLDGVGAEIRVDGGGKTVVRPAAPRQGTRIEVLDLFLNTPARLAFMRTDKTEEAAIVEVFKALALANASVALKLEIDGRKRFDFSVQDRAARIMTIMGDGFAENNIAQHIEHDGMQVDGWLGLPTFHHRDSTRMLFLVNGRVIRDKQLIAALRAGYRDVIFHDRYPVAVICMEIDPADVDVNVHPAKREVRFKSPQSVRSAIVACVRAGIERMGQCVASTTSHQALQAMQRSTEAGADTVASANQAIGGAYSSGNGENPARGSGMPHFSSANVNGSSRSAALPPEMTRMLFSAPHVDEPTAAYDLSVPLDLGRPLAQIHRCYVLAQTDSGVVLVDQHAAHERMTYEKMKQQLAAGRIATQLLLTPEPMTLTSEVAAWLHDHVESLTHFGIELEVAGDETFLIRSVPAMLAGEPLPELVVELVESCHLLGIATEAGRSGGARVLERWLGNRACKGSIKSGRVLSHDEQDALLREMEKTANIAQCNHGRPTYVRLSLNELDRLFGRQD